MPNFHKSIVVLVQRVAEMNKCDINKEFQIILRSYELQIKYGVPQLEAFENSILNPTLKPNLKIEAEQRSQKLRNKSKKHRTLYRYIEKVKEMRMHGISYEKIAKFINAHRTSNKRIKYYKEYIFRFCREYDIKGRSNVL